MTKHNSPDMKASIITEKEFKFLCALHDPEKLTDIIDTIMEVRPTNEDVDKLLMILAANLNV